MSRGCHEDMTRCGNNQSGCLCIPNKSSELCRETVSLVGETGLLLGTLLAVGLDVGTGAASSSEVLLGFSGSGGSKEERVGT